MGDGDNDGQDVVDVVVGKKSTSQGAAIGDAQFWLVGA